MQDELDKFALLDMFPEWNRKVIPLHIHWWGWSESRGMKITGNIYWNNDTCSGEIDIK